ncbi:hypothetical protein Gogos_021357, partial [Gossypium gossypioides]|nr:hypothetical protein [Gossypium gossypioides]
ERPYGGAVTWSSIRGEGSSGCGAGRRAIAARIPPKKKKDNEGSEGGGKDVSRASWLKFQKKTSLAYDKAKLKNKWDWMRNRWSLWKALKGNETLLGVGRKGRKQDSENDASGNNKSSKTESSRRVRGLTMLMEKLDAMVQVVTERSIKDMELMNLEAHTLANSSHTLVDSLAKLVSLPGLIPSTP